MSTYIALMYGLGLIILYFLPSYIANKRRHRNFWPILVLNLFLGWIVIGWIIALIWSFTDNVWPEDDDDYDDDDYDDDDSNKE